MKDVYLILVFWAALDIHEVNPVKTFHRVQAIDSGFISIKAKGCTVFEKIW
jgi:hypothetical protein